MLLTQHSLVSLMMACNGIRLLIFAFVSIKCTLANDELATSPSKVSFETRMFKQCLSAYHVILNHRQQWKYALNEDAFGVKIPHRLVVLIDV